jgi:hypothetical protein
MNFSMGNIVGSLIFSSIGFAVFSYGKRMNAFKMMGLGAFLMTYSMFTPTALTYVIGIGLTALLYFRRDWFND